MSTGRVTFIAVSPHVSDSLSWRATRAIAEADVVIWTGGTVSDGVLRHAPDHADVVIDDNGATHSLLPFYDLASRDGFRVIHIRSDDSTRWDTLFDHVDRCGELGLPTELIRC
ncbi:hypothetical protein [Haloechinothrix salitolerans]|uniref:Uncharacterized protein n=1 Tax=Haloechinothrix salitolerans TaxID=926830 RepID=A0ABW2BYU0_9PSEU